ncbi:MAG: pyridoxal phosphate-dependent decarboxylase family protein [Myxococcota bacterium]
MNELLLTTDQIRDASSRLAEILVGYENSLESRAVFPELDRGALRSILEEPWPEEGRPLGELFDEFAEVIIPNSTHVVHPRYLAYVLASPHGLSPFAEALTAALNQSGSIWTLSPAANAIEQKVLRWLAELFGFPATAIGHITSGGSMANLVALQAARDRALGPTARSGGLQGTRAPLQVYTSAEVHGSVDKAVSMLGLGTDHLVRIPTDDRLRIRVDRLRERISEDRAAGLQPLCVVASAGTVTTGAFDPLRELAALCAEENLWLHVDGAYGALGVLSERIAPLLEGVDAADSIALDPHKLLFNSVEAGCVLLRDRDQARRSFGQESTYIARDADPDLIDFVDYGPQLSRSIKAFKVWWAIRAFGRGAYVRTLDRLLDLAKSMGERVEAHESLELLTPVTFTAVCFRHRRLDEAGHAALLRALLDSGIAYLGPARVSGVPCLRACFTNLRTTDQDVETVLDAVARLGDDLTAR